MELQTSSLEHFHPKLNMEFPHHHTVNVVEEFQISPPLDSVPTATALPLTVFDLTFFFMSIPYSYIFFYELTHPKTYFMDTIFPNIKHSLSVILQHFYPLAGNLTWPQESTLPEIHYDSGDTLLLTLAESSTDYDEDYFHILSGNQAKNASMFVPLIPKLRSRSSEKVGPLSAIQVTLFPNKGISIGLAINHIVADGRTITHFIKSWASICRLDGHDASLIINISIPFYDRSSLKQLNSERAAAIMLHLENDKGISKETFYNVMHNYDQQIVPVDNVRATYMMLSTDIKNLKQLVLSKETEILHLSSLVVTCACVWVCLIKARDSSSSSSDDSNVSDDNMDYFVLPADFRARLNAPLPLTYFGNCLYPVFVATKTSSLTGADGIVFAAKLISNAIFRKMNINDETNEKEDYSWISQKSRITSISSSPKFGVYETDYGWGKPKKVECINDETNDITVSDCPNIEGGFEIGFTRNKIEMDAFASLFAKSLAALS